MPCFVKTIENLLSGNLDKLGANLNLNDLELNINNLNLIGQIYEFDDYIVDTPPIGILYNIKLIENIDNKNYFYSCLKSITDIQELSNIEENIYALASEKSTSKIANLDKYILNKFFVEHNNIDFIDTDAIKNNISSIINSYLSVLQEICIDDRPLYRLLPLIYNLKQ